MPLLRLGYKQIHYTDLKPDGEPRETFILMHGLGSSQNYYHAVAQGLVTSGFRCIAFDNTGAGRSPYTFVEQSVQSLGEDVVGVLDALEVPKAIVVGHSMGGIVVADLAAERSDRIVAAVLVGPTRRRSIVNLDNKLPASSVHEADRCQIDEALSIYRMTTILFHGELFTYSKCRRSRALTLAKRGSREDSLANEDYWSSTVEL